MTTHFIPTDIIHNVSKYKRLSTEIFLLSLTIYLSTPPIQPPLNMDFYLYFPIFEGTTTLKKPHQKKWKKYWIREFQFSTEIPSLPFFWSLEKK